MAEETEVVLTANVAPYEQSIDRAAASTNRLIDGVVRLTTAIDNAFKVAGRTMQIGGAGMVAGMTAAGYAAGRLDQQMSQLQASMTMVTRAQEQYEARMKGFGTAVTNLRSEFGMTSAEAVGLVTQLNKLGQSTRNVDQLAQSFTRLSAVSGEGVGGLVDGMVQLQRTMGTQGVRQTQLFNATLAELSQNAGVSATNILQFSQAIAPVAKVSGMSQKEIMGVSTAFVRAGADGYAASNAFNKMLTDITRSIQYGSPELKAYSNLIGVSVEQFKEMPRTEAITKVFEEINKQGPEAIKTLERFGLDGIRTYKSLQAVASQGGIRSAVADAMGGGDQGKFTAASDKAFDGLNDQLRKMSENGKMIVETFGQGVLPVMNKMATAINSVLSPITALLQGLGKLPGGAMAVAGLGALVAGTVVKAFTGISAFGAAYGAGTTIRQGWRSARMGDPDFNPTRAEMRAYETHGRWQEGDRSKGNWLQHAIYGGAAWASERFPRGGEDRGPGPIRRGMSGLGIMGAQALGSMFRAGLDPLQTRSLRDNFDRDQSVQMFRSSQLRDSVGWTGVQQAWGGLRGVMSGGEGDSLRALSTAGAKAASGLNEAADNSRKMSTVMGQLRHESGLFARALGNAAVNTVGLAGLGAGRIGAAAGSRAWGGLMSAGRMAVGSVGGLGTIGLLGAGYLYDQRSSNTMANMQTLANADNTGPGGAYAAALGEASAATRTFAEVVKNQAKLVADLGFQPKPGASQVDLAARTPGQYTFAGMRGASAGEQMAYAQLLYASNPSEGALSGMQADLLRANGTDAAGQLKTQTAMEVARARSNPNMTALFRGAYAADKYDRPWNAFKTDDAARERAGYAGSGIQQLLAAAPNANAAAGVGIASLNQLALAVKGTGTALFRSQGGDEAMAIAFVRGILGKEGTQEDIDAVRLAIEESQGDPTRMRQLIAQNGPREGIGGAVESMTRRLQQSGGNVLTTKVPVASLYRSSWSAAGVEDIVMDRMTSGNALQRQIFGGVDQGGVTGAVRAAVANQGDAAAQWTGMQRMGEMAIQLAGSFAQASASVDELKAAAGDASSPLYQLAVAARGYIRQRQTESMNYMSQPQVAGQLMANYREDLATDLRNPTAESGTNREQSRQALEQYIAQVKDRLRNYAVQVREFNISRSRGEEDFARQQKWSLDDYNRSREYAEEDYNRQRQFAQEDFTRSRLRAEEDFNHQVVVMARQAAKSITNIYERLTVQRTWSANNLLQNMADQQARLAEQQANLARLRRQGLSGDAISQMGLNDPQNMQQLARLADDMLNNPRMIAEFNRAAQKRLASGTAVVTDKDNEQWKEMQRSFNLNMTRGQEDFNRGMARQEEQFGIMMERQRIQFKLSLDRMTETYQLGMERAGEDLNRSMEEITNNFNDLADTALDTLTGTSRKQMQSLLKTLGYTRNEVYTMTTGLISDVNKLYMSLGISSGGTPTLNGKKLMTGTIKLPDGSTINAGQFAGGGEIEGTSRHKREDNIPIWATAGEYMLPVDSAQYYGKETLDKLRKREIPRGAVQGLADGGPVWKQLQAWAARNLPDLTMTSGYRPGAITALGNVSMHAQGKAIDLAPPNMTAFNKIKGTFGSSIHQLFYSPAGAQQVLRGKNWNSDPVTRSNHWDHIHWAMQSLIAGSGIPGSSGWNGTPEGILQLLNAIPSVKRWDSLHSRGPTVPHAATYGHGAFQKVVAGHILSQLNAGAPAVDSDYVGGSTSIKQMVQQMAAARGWTGSQWQDLASLIQAESGWRPTAQNPSSTAYGLFQFLNSTWKTVGATKTSDPAGQAKAGLQYIAQRYGTPSKAWDFWNSHTPHWYGDGAIFDKATKIGVGERGPEAVMPLNARGVDFMFELMKKNSTESQRALLASNGVPQRASTVSYYSRVDKSTTFTGDISVSANDPDELIRKLESKKKMEALKGRH